MRKHFEQIKLWASIICGIAVIILLMGCASLSNGSIVETESGVIFKSARPAKMTMTKGDKEYTYDSQSEGFFSKLMGILTLGRLAK